MARVEKKYRSGIGVALIVRMLRGSREQRVLQLGLDDLPTYGIMRETDRMQIRAYIDHLIEEGYLTLKGDDYPVLCLGERAGEVLFRGERVSLVIRRQTKAEKTSEKKARTEYSAPDGGLFEALKTLRGKLAQSQRIPAYIIFTNAALADMAARCPGTMSEFLQVSGVGEAKAKRYGAAFLAEIKSWKERQN